MAAFVRDLLQAIRTLRQSPGFTTAVILTFALGIGLNVAMFSVLNAVLLRPLDIARPESLFYGYAFDSAGRMPGLSFMDYREWSRQSRTMRDIAIWIPQSVNYTGGDEPQRLIGGFASEAYLKALDAKTVLGRVFEVTEARPGGPALAVLSEPLWRNRLGGREDVLGKPILLNGAPHTIIGVVGGDPSLGSGVDVWIPLHFWPPYAQLSPATRGFIPLARLRDGISAEQAQTEANTIFSRIAKEYPESKDLRLQLIPVHAALVRQVRPILLALGGAAGFVLLIGCANIANLILVRTFRRRREAAVRAVMGAGRGRLILNLMAESLVLAFAGGLAGVLLARWTLDYLVTSLGSWVTAENVSIDWRVLLFSLAITAAVGLLVGITPALAASRADLVEAMRQARGAGASAAWNRVRALLVVGQVALVVVLLAGAGLMVKSLVNLTKVDPGFDPKNLLSLEYRLPRNKYPTPEQQSQFHAVVVRKVSQIPGVISAACTRAVPFSGNGRPAKFVVMGRPEPAPADQPTALTTAVSPEFFSTMRIPLLKGRVLEARDGTGAPPVIVINRTMAERFWPGEEPIGKRVRLPEEKLTATIIGVVGDIKQFDLDDPAEPQAYAHLDQLPNIFNSLAIRTAGDPMSLARAVTKAISSVDPDQPVWKVRSLEFLVQRNLGSRQSIVSLLSGYSALALVLSLIGTFSVLSYVVSQRSGEIGLRMALGAEPGSIGRLVLRQGLLLVGSGIVLGVAGALGVTRLLQNQLFQVQATDPQVLTVVAVLLLSVSAAACWIPARRAMAIDPATALRDE
ncbi:MAG: ABC transporter permease [Bryobacteraceae bacterium]|nr:ABC transporter permease [Bryobacteraceae bacterium]